MFSLCLTKCEVKQSRLSTVLDTMKQWGLLNLGVDKQYSNQNFLTMCIIKWDAFSHKTKGQHGEDDTAVQGKRRYKREWVKFAKPCREREDNSKRNPIAKVSHISRGDMQFHNKCNRYTLK